MNRAWVDFRAVKPRVSKEMALAHYDVMVRRLDRLRPPTPLLAPKPSVDGECNSIWGMGYEIPA